VATTLPKTKAGFCVSTVSIVSGRDHGSVAVVAGGTERRLARPRIVVCVADDADGADGIFRPRMDPDHSGASSAFTTEGNLNTPYSKERLRTTQAASRPRGGSWANLCEAAANLNAGLPFDASQLTFISMSSQVTRVRGPGAGSCCIEGPNPRFAPR
jgi:hypothetical protein